LLTGFDQAVEGLPPRLHMTYSFYGNFRVGVWPGIAIDVSQCRLD
jgi:hypothetical protein